MNGPVMHLLVAFVWVFIFDNPTLGGFAWGLLMGYFLLSVFQQALFCQHYIRRVNGLVGYMFYFLKEVIISNLRIAMAALSHDPDALGGRYIAYDVKGMNDLEILLLSHSLNLSPGTLVAKHSRSRAEIALHTYAVGEPAKVRRDIDEMRARIMRFTR